MTSTGSPSQICVNYLPNGARSGGPPPNETLLSEEKSYPGDIGEKMLSEGQGARDIGKLSG